VIIIQREQYRSTVHLFIGTGHSLDKITSMSLITNYIYSTDHHGLHILFPFKSVSSFVFSMSPCRSSFNRSFDLYLHVVPKVFLLRGPSAKKKALNSSHPLAFLINQPRASHTTLVVALFSRVAAPCSN
jgi:hypothetical protein